jgi:hypothetical protein
MGIRAVVFDAGGPLDTGVVPEAIIDRRRRAA